MRNYRQDGGISDSLRGGVGGAMRFKITPSKPPGFPSGPLPTKADVDSVARGIGAATGGTSSTISQGAAASAGGNTTAAVAGLGAAAAAGAVGVAALSDSDKTTARLESAEGMLNMAGMASWLAPGAIKLAGGGLNKVGGWTNANWLKRAGTATKDGITKFNNLEFNQVSAKAGVGGWFSKATQPVADFVGTAFDKVAGVLGLKNWRSNAQIGKAAVAHNKAVTLATQIESNIAHAHESLREPLQTLLAAGKTVNPVHLNAEALTAAGEAWKTNLQTIARNKTVLTPQAKALIGQVETMQGHLGDAMHHVQRAGAWKNPGRAISNIPKSISTAKVGHVLMNGAFVAASGVSMIRDKASFSNDMASLKQMAYDLTGEKFSTFGILFGSVPKPIADVRWKVVGKLLALESADAGNIIIQLSRRISPMGSMASMAGVMALSNVANSALSTDFISAYKALSEAHKKGAKFSQDDYAQFLTLTSKDLQSRGADDAAVQALAAKYAAENLSPIEIVKRASDTRLIADLHTLIVANEAKAPKAVSQVAKLQGTPQAAMPVVGEHTKRVAETQSAEQGRVV